MDVRREMIKTSIVPPTGSTMDWSSEHPDLGQNAPGVGKDYSPINFWCSEDVPPLFDVLESPRTVARLSELGLICVRGCLSFI